MHPSKILELLLNNKRFSPWVLSLEFIFDIFFSHEPRFSSILNQMVQQFLRIFVMSPTIPKLPLISSLKNSRVLSSNIFISSSLFDCYTIKGWQSVNLTLVNSLTYSIIANFEKSNIYHCSFQSLWLCFSIQSFKVESFNSQNKRAYING